MRTLFIILALGMTALVASAVLYGPVYAGQGSDNVIALTGAGGQAGVDAPVLFVKKGGGHHGFHGHHGFRGGIYFGSPYGYGYYPDGGYGYGDGEGYYTEGKKVCEWTGYEYKCFQAYR